MPKITRVIALVFAALSLTMTSAHVLEMPQKMRWAAAMYGAVNASLYRWFAIVGGFYTIAAIAAAWAFAWSARRNATVLPWARAGALLLTLAFVSWLVLVAPVNDVMARATAQVPASVPGLWAQFRPRWEYGHLTGFVLQLLGFCALAIAAVADTPSTGRGRAVHTTASILIRAPQERVFALYARWQDWPRLFNKTIRGVRLVRAAGNQRAIDVDHVEGPVPNLMSIVSPELIVLKEHKRRYAARFENRFEPVKEGTRYVVSADVVLSSNLRWLRPIAKPFIRARIRRFVLDPMRRAAEART